LRTYLTSWANQPTAPTVGRIVQEVNAFAVALVCTTDALQSALSDRADLVGFADVPAPTAVSRIVQEVNAFALALVRAA